MMGKRKRSGSWSKGDDSGAKKSDDCDSQEELDGDFYLPKTSTNVRCSARVQEKQEKLRRESSPSKQTVDIICHNACPSGGSVTVICKGKSIPTDDVCLPAPESLPVGLLQHVSLDGKRKKRTWELWSQHDKQLFFEALNEFGKDFDAIQTHLASKLKSKTKTVEPTQIKKKEQVRHFYYRTWNKIQKYLHFPKDMKKAFQELYGLVNYGELRKKQRALNGKTAAKLLELVEKGSTTIKVKGKTLRIKTPVCQALKKINNLTDVEPTKVPSKIVVELLPKDGSAWSVVQCLSHNPRLRSHVMLQRTLASVIVYLEDRWKSSSDRIKEQMMEAFGKRTRRLRIIPSFKRDSSVPIFKAYETTSSAKISLNAFSRNVLNRDTRHGCVKLVESRKRKKSGSMGGQEGATDSVAEADWSDAEVTQETKEMGSYNSVATQLFRNAFGDDSLEVKGMSNEEVQRMLQSIYDFPQTNLQESQEDAEQDEFENGDGDNYLDSDEYQTPTRSYNTDGSNNNCACSSVDEKNIEPEEVFSTSIDEEILKRGWTAEEAGSLTIGEVYMLVGHNEKLCFEYEWDEGDEDTEVNARTGIMLERLISVARNLKKKKQTRHKIFTGPPGSSVCPSCGHSVVGASSSYPVGGSSVVPATNGEPYAPVPAPFSSTPTPIMTNVGSPNSPQISNKSVPSPAPTPACSTTGQQSPTSSTTSLVVVDQNENSPACTASTTSEATTTTTTITTVVTTASASTTATTTTTATESPSTITTTTLVAVIPASVVLPTPVVIPAGVAIKEPEISVKVKKITPTLVSSSCTGTILTSVSAPINPDPIEIPVQSSTTTKEVKEETFRVPVASGGVNGIAPTLPTTTYPRIRPMPSSSSTETTTTDDGPSKYVKRPPKPFLDLPKGNRRLGRPCCKKNIVPRYLPLLPKAAETPPPPPALWEIVGNKSTVHTVFVGNATTQIMLPVTGINLKHGANGPGTLDIGKDDSHIVSSAETNDHTMTNSTLSSPPASVSQPAEPPGTLLPDTSENHLDCSDFKDLLQVSGIEQEKVESNLSLSSFMDISLPESTRNVANECLKSEKFLDVTLGSSSCSLSLSNFLNSNDSNNGIPTLDRSQESVGDESLKTPKKNDMYRNQSPPSNLLTHEHQWLGTDTNELSLGSLLGNLEPAPPVTSSEVSNELNFQSMIEDSNNHLDFTSKFSELVAELESSNNNKK